MRGEGHVKGLMGGLLLVVGALLNRRAKSFYGQGLNPIAMSIYRRKACGVK